MSEMLFQPEQIDFEIHKLEPDKWVSRYADYLYAFALSRLNDQELSRDLIQDTFLSALKKADDFQGKSSERTWLTAILKHKIFDIYRKKSSGLLKGGLNQTSDPDGGYEEYFETENGHWRNETSPEPFGIETGDPFTAKEFNRIIRLCMDKLPPLWQNVFTMKHLDDLESAEIIDKLRLSSGNFWVIIHRAKISLRACLQKNWI